MLPYEERIKPRRTKTNKVFMRAQPGFTDGNAFVGDGLNQFMRCLDAHFEGAKIAVIHAEDARANGQRPRQLLASVDFDERLHSKLAAERKQFGKTRVIKRRDDQEEGIRVRRSRLPDLPRIDDEI